jgi:hypothetical protein
LIFDAPEVAKLVTKSPISAKLYCTLYSKSTKENEKFTWQKKAMLFAFSITTRKICEVETIFHVLLKL